MQRFVPKATFKTRVRDEAVGGDNPFRGRTSPATTFLRIARSSYSPCRAAFTPTCSSTHLPRYEELYEAFAAEGVDDIYCLSVNDAFVMYQWSKHIGAQKVKMLPDGNGEFTRKMGMLVCKDNLGFGQRSWRYAMVVDNKEIKQLFVEDDFDDNCPTDPFEVSDADTVLAWLRGESTPAEKPARAAFVG